MQKTMRCLFCSELRGLSEGKSFIKKFPDSIVKYCRWIKITNEDVLNFNKLMKIEVRRADVKGSTD